MLEHGKRLFNLDSLFEGIREDFEGYMELKIISDNNIIFASNSDEDEIALIINNEYITIDPSDWHLHVVPLLKEGFKVYEKDEYFQFHLSESIDKPTEYSL